jgi:hypothetical protein
MSIERGPFLQRYRSCGYANDRGVLVGNDIITSEAQSALQGQLFRSEPEKALTAQERRRARLPLSAHLGGARDGGVEVDIRSAIGLAPTAEERLPSLVPDVGLHIYSADPLAGRVGANLFLTSQSILLPTWPGTTMPPTASSRKWTAESSTFASC